MMLKVSDTVKTAVRVKWPRKLSRQSSCEVDKFLPCKARRGEGVGVGAKAMLRCLAQVSANRTHDELPVAIPVED